MAIALVLCGLLLCPLAADPAEPALEPLPPAHNHQALVSDVPCPFSESDLPALEYEHVVLANSSVEIRLQHTPSFYEVFAGCNRLGMFILRLTVTSAGTVVKPRMVRGSGCVVADQRVLEAARSWRV